eukprot:1154320-Pelagomonas_calceolata.AAC.7
MTTETFSESLELSSEVSTEKSLRPRASREGSQPASKERKKYIGVKMNRREGGPSARLFG